MSDTDIPYILDGPGSRDNRSDSCYNCIHYLHHQICSAFPDGIPTNIWQLVDNHRSPVTGDHGLQYSRKPYPDPLPDRYDVPDFLKNKL